MNTNIALTEDGILDGRSVPCSVKHGLVIKTWLELPVKGHFTLINDHDPARLRQQLERYWPGAFNWDYLASEDGEYRVKITKTKEIEVPEQPLTSPCN